MKILQAVLIAMGLILLQGCDSAEQGELGQWMAEQKGLAKPGIEPIAEPKKFVPEAYSQAGLVDPFSSQRLVQFIKRDLSKVSENAALLAPELARRKEPLEAFPLDTFAMVGSIHRAGKNVALVRVEKLLYQVQEGEHIGQNYGLIKRITESDLSLREIVQDSSGEWIERTVTLQLEERSKK